MKLNDKKEQIELYINMFNSTFRHYNLTCEYYIFDGDNYLLKLNHTTDGTITLYDGNNYKTVLDLIKNTKKIILFTV